MATINKPINYIVPEKLTLTRKEFRERFENEFKVFTRCLKEIGKYKFMMKYMFNRRNKTKDDLFNTICLAKIGKGNVLRHPSLATSLLYLSTLGFKDWSEFTMADSNYWSRNIQPIHAEIMANEPKFINYNKIITLVD
jgi:hypothetical protein